MKKIIFSVSILILICSVYATYDVIVASSWTDINQKTVNLNDILKDKKEFHILVFRVTDCPPCVNDVIKSIKEIEAEPVGIVGYVKESELKVLKMHDYKIPLLLDKNFQLIRKLKLRKTPVILTVSNDLKVLEVEKI